MSRCIPIALLTALFVGWSSVAKADVVPFIAILNGPTEVPPVPSAGTGFAQITFDTLAHTMRVQVSFSGLTSGTTASHIHAATPLPFFGNAGVATTTPTFAGFPLGVTSGTFDSTLDLTQASSYNPAFLTANGGSIAASEAVLFNASLTNQSYLNIHTANFPGGEIRGFLRLVPEPSSVILMGIGTAGILGSGVRRLRRNPR